ncbi:MAG: hypothetical protein GDA44_13860 [Prochloron sp. SP5CPC1]|nr:hypothetical protein [Candidatus Paraprochloron terpiosi SP5CPC1]
MHDRSDYIKEYYTNAQKAYYTGNYQEAATIIDRMAEDFPDEPTILLLRGHIYCYGLQQYEFAQKQYESVLRLTQDIEYINYANNGLEQARQLQNQKAKAEPKGETEVNYDYRQLDQTETWTPEEDYYDPLDDSALTAAVKTDLNDSIKVMNDSGMEEGLEENSDSEETHVELLLSGYDNNSNAGNKRTDSNDYVNPFEEEPDETSMDWEQFREESEKDKFNQSDDQVRESTGLDPEQIDSEVDPFIDSESDSDIFIDDSQQDTVPTSYPLNKSQPGSDEVGAQGSEPMAQSKFDIASEEISASQTRGGFLEEFDVLNDEELDLITNFASFDVDQELADSGLFNPQKEDLIPEISSSSKSAKTGDRTTIVSSSDYRTSRSGNLTSLTPGV